MPRLAIVGSMVATASVIIGASAGSTSASVPAGWEIAYQGASSYLALYNTGTGQLTMPSYAMAPDTSPAIAARRRRWLLGGVPGAQRRPRHL